MVRRLMLITCSVAVFAWSTSVDDPARTGTVEAAVEAVQQAAENDVESAPKPAKMLRQQLYSSSGLQWWCVRARVSGNVS